MDEAGRGPIAGPVVAAAVYLGESDITGLDDSKVLSARRRAALEPVIRAQCEVGVGIATVEEIDTINILAATMLAMTRAVEQLVRACTDDPVQALIDGNLTPAGRCAGWRWPARAIIGGDGIEPCISAASIIAKETRDRLMIDADADYPGYGLAKHKGYGTKDHMAALRALGPSPLHRRSFAPVRQMELL